MKKNIKKIVGVIACVTLLCAMTGCARYGRKTVDR